MRSVFANGICRSLLAGAFLSIGAGCDDGSDDRGDVTEVPEGINGELVYALDAGPGHVVQFYNFDDGERVAVRESMRVGDTTVLGDDTNEEPDQFLASIFKKLRPALQVPSRILAADKRYVHKRTLLKSMTPDPNWVTAEPAEPKSVLDQAGAGISSAAATCSADLLNDGWGGQWFESNHCLPKCDALFTVCDSNRGGTHYSAAATDRFRYRQMEGDFAVAGKVEAYTTGYPYPTPKYWWTVSLPPRTINEWTFAAVSVSFQTNHFRGTSPCGHLHYTRKVCD